MGVTAGLRELRLLRCEHAGRWVVLLTDRYLIGAPIRAIHWTFAARDDAERFWARRRRRYPTCVASYARAEELDLETLQRVKPYRYRLPRKG